ncbi:uroporphyrin-III C-methyltransferase/precorrin-2 dehydrogenase/sirohydrochlorin ferrochelatase [Sphingobium fontiphilum]|uniref:precorrin-2 dehydrogenase n=1 Tax=Sphingobium fontiphilum TaxID=944425 RepID=A0A7W6DLP8_9SPHN|nr:bifunctional precorrin-2 dehydrogenase/sirohydrochlorin ferrochelatase [Sphingobium fontiphilum]MBB3982917.1 uroporphyrin-III C-methyltransferase/precorrin-2 dehydrogenase/sirohydrochlorin ferrochelatase [Sphingobium fontiphilum]
MHSLPVFLRLTGRAVILTGMGEAADAKRRLLERAGAVIVGEEAEAAIAIVSDGDEATAQRLRARGVLVNATDRPEHCDFTLPAIVDRDPVLIAIGTGGASAGLAKALRQRLEAMLPARLGALADALAQARGAMKARWPGAADRRRAIDAALAPGGVLDPLRADAADAVPGWLSADGAAATQGTVPIRLLSADPDDLTLRAARLLGEADVVYHHPAVPPAILHRARADAVRIIADAMPDASGEGLTLWLEMAE